MRQAYQNASRLGGPEFEALRERLAELALLDRVEAIVKKTILT